MKFNILTQIEIAFTFTEYFMDNCDSSAHLKDMMNVMCVSYSYYIYILLSCDGGTLHE